MSDTTRYALLVALGSGVGLAAVLSNRLTEKVKVPAPLLVLIAAAIAVKAAPSLHSPSESAVEHIVTIALILILFDGGMHIGWPRFRAAAAPIGIVGVVGTVLTAAAGGLLLHLAFGIPAYLALLAATAVAPTDPAVVFAVLGKREIDGRSGTILEGESGANDPVGIALMVGLIGAGSLSASAAGHVVGQFALQMGVGAAFGLAGGQALLWFMRRVSLPSEGLYSLRTLACAGALFGVTALCQGSGFLAVFLAGIIVGEAPAPYKSEVRSFHAALAGLGEIVAFVVLGITVDLKILTHSDVWIPGLVLAVALTVVIRPIAVAVCLLPARLPGNERNFILFAGLKGAVPILLAELIRAAHLPQAERLYGIVVVVVIFSVLVQGSLVPTVADRLRLPMRPLP